MEYEFKCQKVTCGRVFSEIMSLSRYEKVRAMDPPYYEIRCPMCWTKAPERHFSPESAPAVHRDYGEWDPKYAHKDLAGKSWTSKDEKEKQVREVLGDSFSVGEVDRDKTVKPKNRQAVTTKAKDAKVIGAPTDLEAALRTAVEPGEPFKIAEVARRIGAQYRPVYALALRIGEKVGPGEFTIAAA